MNKHLKLVREFHDAFSFPQAEEGKNVRLSEMQIIMRQALLMKEGSELLKAFKAGDMVEILAGMINLSYCALALLNKSKFGRSYPFLTLVIFLRTQACQGSSFC